MNITTNSTDMKIHKVTVDIKDGADPILHKISEFSRYNEVACINICYDLMYLLSINKREYAHWRYAQTEVETEFYGIPIYACVNIKNQIHFIYK